MTAHTDTTYLLDHTAYADSYAKGIRVRTDHAEVMFAFESVVPMSDRAAFWRRLSAVALSESVKCLDADIPTQRTGDHDAAEVGA